MENAADALKIAFAIFVFVIAITLLFISISQARATSDDVFYAIDDTNFHEPVLSEKENRTVGISEVISMLYRYYKESVAVTVILKDGSTYYFDVNYENVLVKDKVTVIVKDKNKNVLIHLNSTEDIERNLGNFITSDKCLGKLLLLSSNDVSFYERFVEVPTSGIYSTGDDGTEIALASGGKKIYITYVQK